MQKLTRDQINDALREMNLDFRLEGDADEGGYGSVYKVAGSDEVAKVLDLAYLCFRAEERRLPPLDYDGVYQELDYARRLTLIKNTNLVPVSGLHRCDVWMGMEEGVRQVFLLRMPRRVPLDRAAWPAGKPDENEIISIVSDVCRALETIHQDEVRIDDGFGGEEEQFVPGPLIHRDIKPDNVFVYDGPDGVRYYQLGDFGACFLSGNSRIRGQRKYINRVYSAPEMDDEVRIGPASDVFSLGFLIYWWMNGRADPVEARKERFAAGFEEKHRLKNMSPELWSVFMKATQFDPEMRYPTAAALRKALADCVETRDARIGRKEKGAYMAGGAAAALAAIGLINKLTDGKSRSATVCRNEEIDFGNGVIYRGNVKNGVPHGSGRLQLPYGMQLEAHWSEGVLGGAGRMLYSDGRALKGKNWTMVSREECQLHGYEVAYTGTLCDGVHSGFGGMTGAVGFKYFGELVGGRLEGRGVYCFADGKRKLDRVWSYQDGKKARSPYTGMLLNGKPCGLGRHQLKDGGEYIGEFLDGAVTGYGRQVDKTGRILYEGIWEGGRLVESKK